LSTHPINFVKVVENILCELKAVSVIVAV